MSIDAEEGPWSSPVDSRRLGLHGWSPGALDQDGEAGRARAARETTDGVMTPVFAKGHSPRE
jgi:hypothetical protein